MPSPDEIRARLKAEGRKKAKAEEARQEAAEELAKLFRQVQETEGVSMSEAAKLAGVSRYTAYEMLKEER